MKELNPIMNSFEPFRLETITPEPVPLKDRVCAVHGQFLAALSHIKQDTETLPYDCELNAIKDLILSSGDLLNDYLGQIEKHEQEQEHVFGGEYE